MNACENSCDHRWLLAQHARRLHAPSRTADPERSQDDDCFQRRVLFAPTRPLTDLGAEFAALDDRTLIVAAALAAQDAVPVTPLPARFDDAFVPALEAAARTSPDAATCTAALERDGFFAYTPSCTPAQWYACLELVRSTLAPRLQCHGAELRIEADASLPQLSFFQHQRYCVSFDYLAVPVALRRAWLPRALLDALTHKLGGDFQLARSEVFVNACTDIGCTAQCTHRDIAETAHDGVVPWMMQIWPPGAVTTAVHARTHTTTETLRADALAARATLEHAAVAFDARLQHFGNSSTESNYKLNFTFVAAREATWFATNAAYSSVRFAFAPVRAVDLFAER